jgi:hypothetical protein
MIAMTIIISTNVKPAFRLAFLIISEFFSCDLWRGRCSGFINYDYYLVSTNYPPQAAGALEAVTVPSPGISLKKALVTRRKDLAPLRVDRSKTSRISGRLVTGQDGGIWDVHEGQTKSEQGSLYGDPQGKICHSNSQLGSSEP